MVGISGDAAATILHPDFIKGWGKTTEAKCVAEKELTRTQGRSAYPNLEAIIMRFWILSILYLSCH